MKNYLLAFFVMFFTFVGVCSIGIFIANMLTPLIGVWGTIIGAALMGTLYGCTLPNIAQRFVDDR